MVSNCCWWQSTICPLLRMVIVYPFLANDQCLIVRITVDRPTNVSHFSSYFACRNDTLCRSLAHVLFHGTHAMDEKPYEAILQTQNAMRRQPLNISHFDRGCVPCTVLCAFCTLPLLCWPFNFTNIRRLHLFGLFMHAVERNSAWPPFILAKRRDRTFSNIWLYCACVCCLCFLFFVFIFGFFFVCLVSLPPYSFLRLALTYLCISLRLFFISSVVSKIFWRIKKIQTNNNNNNNNVI